MAEDSMARVLSQTIFSFNNVYKMMEKAQKTYQIQYIVNTVENLLNYLLYFVQDLKHNNQTLLITVIYILVYM